MAKAHETWTVLPHAPIEVLADNLWRVEGGLPNMPMKRVMTIARMAEGGLVIHNAIALDDESMGRIDAWGPVKFLVVPNGLHRLDAKIFKDRYPDATVLCPRGGRKKVGEVVAVDGHYEDFPADPTIRFEVLEGVKKQEGVMIVRSADGVTLVFNDAVFNMPHGRGLQGWIFKHVTQSSGGPKVSRLARLLLVGDRRAFHDHLLRLAELPDLRRAIVSHHEMITGDVAAALRQAATWVA